MEGQEGTFTIADVLGTSYDDKSGTILLQVGDVITKKVESEGVEMWPTLGIMCRPAAADPGRGAAQGFLVRGIDHWVSLGLRDVRRQQEIIGNLSPGDTCVYALAGMAQVFARADGRCGFYTTTTNDNSASGMGIGFEIGPKGLRIETPYGRIVLDETGFHITLPSGASFDLGGVGGIPAFGSVGSYAIIQAATVHVDGAMTYVGPNPVANAVGVAAPGAPGISGVGVGNVFVG